jgi:hypothetical protein
MLTQAFLLGDSFHNSVVDMLEDLIFGDMGTIRNFLSLKTYFLTFFSPIFLQVTCLYAFVYGLNGIELGDEGAKKWRADDWEASLKNGISPIHFGILKENTQGHMICVFFAAMAWWIPSFIKLGLSLDPVTAIAAQIEKKDEPKVE